MDGIVMAAQLICGLSLLVFVHELGHFLAAKMFGMRVDKFFIFFDAFGTKLWSKTVGETEYGVGWLPLGGYVKIAGMIDESMDKDAMKGEPQSWEFRSKPAWQRFIVMIGGIVMNIITGVIIFAGYLGTYEKDYIANEDLDKGIYAFQLAQEVGFQTGDKLLSINGKSPKRFKDYKSVGVFFGSDIVVDRGGERVNVNVPNDFFARPEVKGGAPLFEPFEHRVAVAFEPGPDTGAGSCGLQKGDEFHSLDGQVVRNFDKFREILVAHSNGNIPLEIIRGDEKVRLSCQVDSLGRLGFSPRFNSKADNTTNQYSIGETIVYGWREGWDAMYYNAVGIWKMVSGQMPALENMQSPIGIARNIYGPVWEWDRFWRITGLLSFILAFMNILPIPALDGGHIMFILFEVAMGRPLSDKFLERAQIVGMLILLPLMVLILGKDLWEAINESFGMIFFF